VASESLRVTEGNAAGAEIELGDEFEIGRATVGDGRLGEDPELSRRHARILRRAGDQLTIEDLGSTNGTFVNGRQVDGTVELKPGDKIKVGTTTIEVLDASGQAPQATALGKVPEPKDQATEPRERPAPVPPPAPAPPPRAPAGEPGRPPGPPPGRRPGPPGRRPGPPGRRPGPPIPLIAGVGILAVAAIVAVVMLAGGGDDEPETVSAAEIVEDNTASTLSINTKGPGFDDAGNKVTQLGGGTGIVVDASRGYVLTNAHVVTGATSVKALIEGGSEVNARRLGTAPCEDLAVIQLSPRPQGLKAATLGSSSGAAAGDEVTTLGFPGAFEEDITKRRLQSTPGAVSSKPASATLGADLPTLPSVIQHTAPISPGNSGGPLFNDEGEVIGVNTVSAGGESQNQNGAIAIDRARSILKDLEAGKDIGYVGWNLTEITGSSSLPDGLYVGAEPEANSPADRANMFFGDRIDELDGTAVATVPDACDILGSKSAGDQLKVTGQQLDGTTYEITIKLR
jgi:S1-C subfamily serine protease